jgi:hypothetical protein
MALSHQGARLWGSLLGFTGAAAWLNPCSGRRSVCAGLMQQQPDKVRGWLLGKRFAGCHCCRSRAAHRSCPGPPPPSLCPTMSTGSNHPSAHHWHSAGDPHSQEVHPAGVAPSPAARPPVWMQQHRQSHHRAAASITSNLTTTPHHCLPAAHRPVPLPAWPVGRLIHTWDPHCGWLLHHKHPAAAGAYGHIRACRKAQRSPAHCLAAPPGARWSRCLQHCRPCQLRSPASLQWRWLTIPRVALQAKVGDRVEVAVGGSFHYLPGYECRPLLLVAGASASTLSSQSSNTAGRWPRQAG